MNVDPALPQPGLITALQQLAEKPLEFGEEEGEFVAADGGISRFATPEARPPGGTFSLPDLFAFLSQRQVPGEEGFQEAAFDIPPPTDFPNSMRPGSPSLASEAHRNFFQPGIAPDAPDTAAGSVRLPSFSESVGEGGERSFTLDGGSESGSVGAAGISAGLDPSKGLVGGGESFAPEATRVGSGPGAISGSFSILDPETGLPMDFGEEQLSRLDRAQKVAELTRSSIILDPIGGPAKQARMHRAMEIANREVDSSVNEMIKLEEIRRSTQDANSTSVAAQAQLNTSLAASLQAEAQKTTAEGAYAKVVLESQKGNPALILAMNQLAELVKNPEATGEDRDRLMAAIQFHLQQAGAEFKEKSFLGALFSFGSNFSVGPTTPQQGAPGDITGIQGSPLNREQFAEGGVVEGNEEAPAEEAPAGEGVSETVGTANDGNLELQALMSRAKAGMSPEDFQHIMEIM